MSKHERAFLEGGAEKYHQQQDKKRGSGLGNETDAAKAIISNGIISMAQQLDWIANTKKPGRGNHYNPLIREVADKASDGYLTPVSIAIQTIFQALSKEPFVKIGSLVHAIALRLEMELKLDRFAAEYPGYVAKVIKSFDTSMVSSYDHKHKVMSKKFNEFNIEWNDWSPTDRAHIGMKVLQACMFGVPDLFEHTKKVIKGKTIAMLTFHTHADEWIAAFEVARGNLRPLMRPLPYMPVDWERTETGDIIGGFQSLRLQQLTPFIKAFNPTHKEYNRQANPEAHINAINKMQRTAWEVNPDILYWQTECQKVGIGLPNAEKTDKPEFPAHLRHETLTEVEEEEKIAHLQMVKSLHEEDKKRKGKVIAYMNIAKVAKDYAKEEKFYFVYTCDFRGRIYCTSSGLSPQGEDSAKGLLRFNRGVRLGDRGLFWLAIQGANTFGFDKADYAGRVEYIRSLESVIQRVVTDPINERFWLEADKPWQFLAFCFEWSRADYGRDSSCIGHLAVGLDGSCNGLQHYSAILRDHVGGAAVNLTDSTTPQDIYGEVAIVLEEKLKLLCIKGDTVAGKWLKVGINRKLAKRPVMTLPYGATQQSARQCCYEYVIDNQAKFNVPPEALWSFASYITPILWQSIGEVVIAAREGMDWIVKASRDVVNVTDQSVRWLTPIGFPVMQRYYENHTKRIRSHLLMDLQLHVSEATETVDKSRSANGIAPNYVHSLDSTHLVMTANAVGVDDLAFIHDDYGTHAGNTETLYHEIRGQFQLLHYTNQFVHWYNQQPVDHDWEAMPETGNLDINDVSASTYFFG